LAGKTVASPRDRGRELHFSIGAGAESFTGLPTAAGKKNAADIRRSPRGV
jgi:hypothetical protein